MSKAYWDIIPRQKEKVVIPEIPKEVYQEADAHALPTEIMLKELWERGVPIERVFGFFYELEAIADAQIDEIFGNDEEGQHGRKNVLTVGDAQLAGFTGEQIKKQEGQIF